MSQKRAITKHGTNHTKENKQFATTSNHESNHAYTSKQLYSSSLVSSSSSVSYQSSLASTNTFFILKSNPSARSSSSSALRPGQPPASSNVDGYKRPLVRNCPTSS